MSSCHYQPRGSYAISGLLPLPERRYINKVKSKLWTCYWSSAYIHSFSIPGNLLWVECGWQNLFQIDICQTSLKAQT